MKPAGSVRIGDACSRAGCAGRPIAVAPFGTGQLIFLCEEHADEVVRIVAENDETLTGFVKSIVPTCRALIGGTTPCGAASTRVTVFTTGDGFETSCMCDRHTAATASRARSQ